MRPSRPCLVLLQALCFALPVSLAAQIQPLGPELRGNAGEAHRPRRPVAVYGPGGSFALVWENDQLGIQARRFDAAGEAQGGDLDLVPNSRLPRIPAAGPVVYRSEPAVAGEASGGFLLFWSEERSIQHVVPFQEWREVQRRDIFGQRFSAAVKPVGARFRVNDETGVLHNRAAVARSGDRVLVVWDALDGAADAGSRSWVFARLMGSDGTPLSGLKRVNTAPTEKTGRAAVAVNRDGTFLVTWEACCDAQQNGIFARLYDSNAQPLTGVFPVNTRTAGQQNRPAVVANERGEFLVAWQGRFEEPLDARIWGQMVDAHGALVGGEIQISANEAGGSAHVAPSLATLPGGGFFVAWVGYEMPFPTGVYGVELNPLATPVAGEFEISTGQAGAQFKTFIAARGQGELLVAYEGYLGEEVGVAAQRLSSGSERSQGLAQR